MATTALTYERLDRLLRYDMATGLFYWKERRGKKGVSWNRQKAKWESRIQVDGKIMFLGYHVDIDAAGRAYEKASVEHFGQFARAA